MSVVLKFACAGDIRRLQLSPAEISEGKLRSKAQECFPSLRDTDFDLKYRDEEGDLCVLTDRTFEDFAALNRGAFDNFAAMKQVLKLEIVRKAAASAPSAVAPALGTESAAAAAPLLQQLLQNQLGELFQHSEGVDSHGDATMLGGADAATPPFAHILQHILAATAGPTAGTGDILGSLIIHFSPMLEHHLSNNCSKVDEFAASKPELIVALAKLLRESLGPFPQFQEAHIALDRMLQTQCWNGLAAVLASVLRIFRTLSEEQQRCVVTVACEGLPEVLQQLHPEVVGEASSAEAVHHGVVCDGCDKTPIVGPRYKSKVWDDYDLCAACYARRGDFHADHSFECLLQPRASGCFKGGGKGWWPFHGHGHHGHGGFPSFWTHGHHGHGHGHHGWNRWNGWKGHHKGFGKAGKDCGKRHKKCDRKERSASSSGSSDSESSSPSSGVDLKRWKQQQKELKRQFKKETKALKKAHKEAKKACKKELKEQRKRAKAEAKLSKSSGSAAQATASAAMDLDATAVDVEPSAPPAEAAAQPCLAEQMTMLEAMGFTDSELNYQLLTELNGDVQAVLDTLIVDKK